MIKPVLTIAAAAACAGIVVLAPELDLKSAMAATQSVEAQAPKQGNIVSKEKQQSERSCSLHWPYYEQGCLRGPRSTNGIERAVRVIPIDHIGNH